MAERCAMCGNELGFLGRGSIQLYGTVQPVCRDCEKSYNAKADEPERERRRQKLLSSPWLREREHVEKLIAEQEEQRQRQQAEQVRQAQLEEERARARQEQTRCCGQEMEDMGPFVFQLGQHGFFTGDWNHLAAGAMEMTMYRCPCCGQVKFFDAEHR